MISIDLCIVKKLTRREEKLAYRLGWWRRCSLWPNMIELTKRKKCKEWITANRGMYIDKWILNQ